LYTDDGPKFPLVLASPHAKKNKRAAARPFYWFSGLSEDEKPPPSTLNFNQCQDKEETHSDEESAATTQLEEVKPTAPLKMTDNTNMKAVLPLNSGVCGD
jgi:hypothetical protein